MPFYAFICSCGRSFDRRLQSPKSRAKCVCGSYGRRDYSSPFSALNTVKVGGLQGFQHAIGYAPESVNEAARAMAEHKVAPAEDVRYFKHSLERKELTEQELASVLVENLGNV